MIQYNLESKPCFQAPHPMLLKADPGYPKIYSPPPPPHPQLQLSVRS